MIETEFQRRLARTYAAAEIPVQSEHAQNLGFNGREVKKTKEVVRSADELLTALLSYPPASFLFSGYKKVGKRKDAKNFRLTAQPALKSFDLNHLVVKIHQNPPKKQKNNGVFLCRSYTNDFARASLCAQVMAEFGIWEIWFNELRGQDVQAVGNTAEILRRFSASFPEAIKLVRSQSNYLESTIGLHLSNLSKRK